MFIEGVAAHFHLEQSFNIVQAMTEKRPGLLQTCPTCRFMAACSWADLLACPKVDNKWVHEYANGCQGALAREEHSKLMTK